MGFLNSNRFIHISVYKMTYSQTFIVGRRCTPSASKFLFSPESIAVIGASEKLGVDETIFSNIRNIYNGKVYAITPSHTTVFSINAYKSVLDVPEDIDLAVI